MNKFFETENMFVVNRDYFGLRDWLLPMLMMRQVEMNSNLKDAGLEDDGLGWVAESGEEYKKGK